jgi:hypothetical protein
MTKQPKMPITEAVDDFMFAADVNTDLIEVINVIIVSTDCCEEDYLLTSSHDCVYTPTRMCRVQCVVGLDRSCIYRHARALLSLSHHRSTS